MKILELAGLKSIKGKEFRGYNASKREYFYGFKTAAAAVHVVTTSEGIPVEFLVTSGNIDDSTSFQGMFMDFRKTVAYMPMQPI